VLLDGDVFSLAREGECRLQDSGFKVAIVAQPIELAQLCEDALEYVDTPPFQALLCTAISLAQHLVVTLAIIAEHCSGVQQSTAGGDIESALDEHQVRQQTNHPSIAIGERVNPSESVMRERHFHKVVLLRIVRIDERHQLIHVPTDLHRIRREVLRLRNANLGRPELTGSPIPFPVEPPYSNGVQFSNEREADVVSFLEMLLDEAHGPLDVGDFAQLIGSRVISLHLTFHIISEGCVVAFNSGGAKAFQNVENILELEEKARWSRTRQPVAA